MGLAEIEAKQSLMDDENGFIDGNQPLVYGASRRDPFRRTHPLWNSVKIAATIGWIGLMSYGLVRFLDSMYSLSVLSIKL